MERAAGMEWLRHLLAWLLAVAVTAVAGTIVQTQFNLGAIALLNAMLPVTPIAATRSLAGFAALAATGAPGGWIFAVLARRRAGQDVA
jgi:hypothetical protein